MTIEPKPYHEMSFADYTATAHSQFVPKWSILAIPPDSYSVRQLCRFSGEQLRVLAFLWGVNRDGSKQTLAERIIRRHQFRLMLSQENENSLACKPRKELATIAQEAGVFHPWLNRRGIAVQLIRWRSAARDRVRTEIAKARHERVIRQAARRGLYIPAENLDKYGIDAQGNYEQTILGIPLGRASRLAPEAVAAAKSLCKEEFMTWLGANPAASGRLVFLEAGILGDGGALFWSSVQKAIEPASVLPLFAGL
jgi:hypothetical protein